LNVALVLVLSVVLPVLVVPGLAQELEPRMLINLPTAGLLERGSYVVDLRVEPGGGLLSGVAVGLATRFMFGVSYGGSDIVGAGWPDWNPRAEFAAKYRFIDETPYLPALALGFDSQGSGGFDDARDRYWIKSRGFYAVLSKSVALLGPTSLHGGVNYSLERSDGDREVNAFTGVEKGISPELVLVVEYDAALNDDDSAVTRRGYLNAGVRWMFAGQLTLGIDFNDLLQHKGRINRSIRVSYADYF
jgi:hypothetical protein